MASKNVGFPEKDFPSHVFDLYALFQSKYPSHLIKSLQEKTKGTSMPNTTVFFVLLLFLSTITATFNTTSSSFHFEGFNAENLTLSNSTNITNGLLHLTDDIEYVIGHAFFPTPFPLKHSLSFSTTFIFAISYLNKEGGDGMAFTLSPSPTLPHSSAGHYLGLFNKTSNNNPSSHMLAIVLDTIKNVDFDDISDNYVGVNINGLTSKRSANASYYQNGEWKRLDLHSGKAMQVWIEYNASTNVVEVTLAPLHVPKPQTPLLSSKVNLSSILANETYVGFSAATGAAHGYHYVLGWSFSMDGEPLPSLDLNALPPVINNSKPAEPPEPQEEQASKQSLNIITAIIIFSVIFAMVVAMLCISGITYWVRRKRRFEEIIEEAELLHCPSRIRYKDLYKATNGFQEENLLGAGGSGQVYKGTLPKSHAQVAVKKISHHSSQGNKEFVAEVSSMARLKQKNLVQLIGYCRTKRELLVVYEYMENGSLDKFLYGPKKETLSWERRFRVARGVAEGLQYLHEGWEQVVVHRDVKASNVLLDADFNGRLGDFGLAKLYHRGESHLQTTCFVGTLGYMAPEMARTGKATTITDVYAFGAFLLELVSGKRPMVTREGMEATPMFLQDRVMELWRRDNILAAIDTRLGDEYEANEAETLLKLGVLCTHKVPASRPTMRHVVQVLEGNLLLPAAPPESGSGPEMSTVAEGEAPMSSFPSPMEEFGNEYSSLAVEANSLNLTGDNRDLYVYPME